MIEETNTEVVVEEVITPEVPAEKDALTLAQEKIAKIEAERDNYKRVALQRKGKLAADDEFFKAETPTAQELADEVRMILLEREAETARQEEKEAIAKLQRENAELRLVAKNKPGSPLGGSSGAASEVKDNVFSDAQIAVLTKKAERLGTDPAKFIENAKRNLIK